MIQLKLPLLDQVTIVSGQIAIRYRISSCRFEDCTNPRWGRHRKELR